MALPVLKKDLAPAELDKIVENATTASNFLKAISHEGRLMILCHLVTGEKSVTELEELLSARQAAVSQQLARLRLEGLVMPRRDGKTIAWINNAQWERFLMVKEGILRSDSPNGIWELTEDYR